MDIRLALMMGTDIPIPECQITLHQPTFEDISYIGEEDFFIGTQTICLYKNMFIEDKKVLQEVNNFQIFMMIMGDKETIDKKRSTLKVLQILFPKYKVLLSPRSLIFQEENGETHMVDETNFEKLQEVAREVFCSKNGSMDQQAFNPANAKAKEIADKLMRGRKRVAEQKNLANISIFSQYISILSVGLKLPITQFKKYTMYMLYDQMERFTLNTNWDMDTKVRLAGGKPENQPDNWMKNIH